jgi:hypothetical protein
MGPHDHGSIGRGREVVEAVWGERTEAEVLHDRLFLAGLPDVLRDSHPASFNSMLAFIEHTFGLPPMSNQDGRAYDYSGSFNYGQRPLSAPVRMVHTRVPEWELRYIAQHPGDVNDPT